MKNGRMFNAENKERFLEQHGSTQTMDALFRNVFDMIAPYEEERGADICTWSAEELKTVLEVLSGFRSYSSGNRAGLLRRYIKWCLETGFPGATDAAFHTRASGLNKVREMTLSGPAHLERCLNGILSPSAELTNDNILRGFCWLAYSGMAEDDIVRVRIGDVDFRRYRVVCNGESYPIYEAAVPCLKILKELSAFKYYHPNYEDGFIWRPRMDGDKLLRGIRSSSPSAMMFRSKISKLASDAFREKKIDVKISYYRIWISGEFYRAYLKERAGYRADFSDLAERAVKVREEKRGPYQLESGSNRRTEGSKKREISADFKDDYLRWKLAYASEL